MKAISIILAICLTVVTAALISIIRSGVSIRTAPIIKPSVTGAHLENVPQGVFLRLFPDFQQAHYTIWGIQHNSTEVQKTLNTMKKLYEKEFKVTVNIIKQDQVVGNLKGTEPSEIVKNCSKPCWIFLPENEAHELTANTWMEENIKPLNRGYFTLTWIDFSRQAQVPEYCVKEKRLDLECLKVVSINEVERKIKDSENRYFFMRKYLDRDYFLFVEKRP